MEEVSPLIMHWARIGTGKEVAEAIQFLAQAKWVVGVGLKVDAGLGVGVLNN
jgi:NAD(P)-dependent dehydrogenase (short-subunit alcohol dehydrogenase family)